MAITAACLVPPEIDVEPNYPPTVDTSRVAPAPFQVILDQGVGALCEWPRIQIQDIAIQDRNQDDEHYLRFFIAVNGDWQDERLGFIPQPTIFGHEINFTPEEFAGALGDSDSMLIVVSVLITDRPWPSEEESDDAREVAPGAGRAELYWIIEVTEEGCEES